MCTLTTAVLVALAVPAAFAAPRHTGGWMEAGCQLSGPNDEVLDCSGDITDGKLTQVPTDLPATVVHLWLNGNQIQGLRAGDFATTPALRYLFLENNEIESMEHGTFEVWYTLLIYYPISHTKQPYIRTKWCNVANCRTF